MTEESLSEREQIKKVILDTAAKFLRKPPSEFLAQVLAHVRFLNLTLDDTRQLAVMIEGCHTFPSFAAIKKECDRLLQKRKIYGNAASLIHYPKMIVPGTPPTWEALFILIKNKQMETTAFKIALERKKEKGFSEETIWEAYGKWVEGQVLEEILK